MALSRLGESKLNPDASTVQGLIFIDWDDTAVRGDNGLNFLNNENVRNLFFTAKQWHCKIFIITARHNTVEQKNNILAMLESIGVVNAFNRNGWASQIFCVREEGVKLSFEEIAQAKKNVIINIMRQHPQVKRENTLFCDDLTVNLNVVGDAVGIICLAQPRGQHFQTIMEFMTGPKHTQVEAEQEQPKHNPATISIMPMEIATKQLQSKQNSDCCNEKKVRTGCACSVCLLVAASLGLLVYLKIADKNHKNNPNPAPAPNFNGTRFSLLSNPDSSPQQDPTVNINAENNILTLPLELRNTLQVAAQNGVVSSLLLTLQGDALTSYLSKYHWSEERIFWAQQALSALTMFALTSSVSCSASLPAMTILLRNYFGFETENARLIAAAAFGGFNVLGTTAVQTFRAAYQFVMNPSVLGAANVLVTGAFSAASNVTRLTIGAAGSAVGYGAARLSQFGFYAAKRIFGKSAPTALDSAPLKLDMA